MSDQTITSATLEAWGYRAGGWFRAAIAAANEARQHGACDARVREIIDRHAEPERRAS